jgi:hypothetical protein
VSGHHEVGHRPAGQPVQRHDSIGNRVKWQSTAANDNLYLYSHFDVAIANHAGKPLAFLIELNFP